MLRLSRAALLVSLAVLAAPAASWGAGLEGEDAADFTLTDTDGVVHTLSDYHGTVVFLNIFGYG